MNKSDQCKGARRKKHVYIHYAKGLLKGVTQVSKGTKRDTKTRNLHGNTSLAIGYFIGRPNARKLLAVMV